MNDSESAIAVAAEPSPGPRRPAHVLIVDNNRDSSIILRRILSSEEFDGLLETLEILSDNVLVKRLVEADDELSSGGGYSLEEVRQELASGGG